MEVACTRDEKVVQRGSENVVDHTPEVGVGMGPLTQAERLENGPVKEPQPAEKPLHVETAVTRVRTFPPNPPPLHLLSGQQQLPVTYCCAEASNGPCNVSAKRENRKFIFLIWPRGGKGGRRRKGLRKEEGVR